MLNDLMEDVFLKSQPFLLHALFREESIIPFEFPIIFPAIIFNVNPKIIP